ncbi:MAG: UvrD-helicase domain-containing protein [Rikenellaceae bacterium]
MRATVLNASAGSGKTYRLAYRYVRDVINQPSLYRNILAVTFTNKATEEMKSRILAQINLLSSGKESGYLQELMQELSLSEDVVRSRAATAQGNILHDYSRFTVVTIDRFFQRIIRAFIQELGIDLNYNIEIETEDMLTQSADSIIESISTNEELRRWLLEFVSERIDSSNKWDIRGAITGLGSEIFKESVAVQLKNSKSKDELKEIVQKWQRRASESKNQIQELGKRAMAAITSAGVNCSDFSGKSRSFTLYFNKIANGDISAPTKTHRDRATSIDGWRAKDSHISTSLVEQLREILDEICSSYDRDIKLWNTATLLGENYRSFALLGDLYQMVEKLCEEQNMMLLSQSKNMLTEFIAGNDTPFIYEKIGNYYSRFLLDEFQDTSSMEWRNLMPLLQNAMSQSEDSSVFIVGDIKQSIYRWRGGDWKILHSGVKEGLGEDDTQVVNLQDNWRSGSTIVEFINSSIAQIVKGDNSYLNNILDEALSNEVITNELHHSLFDITAKAYSSHTQNPRRNSKGFVEVCEYIEEPPYLESIKEVLDLGYRPCDIMILTRSRNQGVEVAEALLEFKAINTEARYSFDVMTQEALIIGNSAICRFIIALFSLSVDPSKRVELAIYNRFIESENIDTPISGERLEFLSSLRQLSIVEAFDMCVIEFNLDDYNSQISSLQAIHEQIISYASSKVGDIALFVKWWEEHGASKSLSVEQSDSTIEITTIHKAKGLEKRVVIIPYCSWDVEPKSSSGTSSNVIWAYEQSVGNFPLRVKSIIAESHMAQEYYRERVYSHIDAINLLYVALTRAVDALYIFTKSRDSKIGGMLMATLPQSEKELLGETHQRGEVTYHLFGEKSRANYTINSSPTKVVKIDNYPTRESQLTLSLPSQRYREDSQEEFSPRDIGILMHSLFESAQSSRDIMEGIETMVASAKINRAEGEIIRENFSVAIQNPIINEWFESQWDRVLCEQAIIIPNSRHIRRPDRVMIKGERAVVVDYKFGVLNEKRHHRQVSHYMQLLTEMGYTQVEGWLWHIKSGELEAVNR